MNLDDKLSRLSELTAELRGENGCPWDREQTHKSLTRYLIEEAYETLGAIEKGDDDHLKEELGDLLLQVVLHAQIASERGAFDLADVIASIHEKIVRRHPHVFLDGKAADTEAALRSWQTIKEEEGKDVMADLPVALPSLTHASKVQEAAGRAGFDWPDSTGVIKKLEEEMAELKADIDMGKAQEELGDILFTAVNLARHLGVDAETALAGSIDKFKRRFNWMVERAKEDGSDFNELELEEKEHLWTMAKEAT